MYNTMSYNSVMFKNIKIFHIFKCDKCDYTMWCKTMLLSKKKNSECIDDYSKINTF